MIIAVNTSCLIKDEHECSNFIKEVFNGLARANKKDTFIYIFDEPQGPPIVFPPNVIPVTMGPYPNTTIKKYVWFNIKIPRLLKKYKAEIFISVGACSLVTKVPQCLILYGLSFLHSSALAKKNHSFFYKKNISRFIKKATSVIALSEYSKALIHRNYKTPLDKIEVVRGVANDLYKPVIPGEREKIKNKYADGFEYFICAVNAYADTNLINVLKAYSAFKKRQKSSMQLLIAGDTVKDDAFEKSFSLFRFKQEVKLLPRLPQKEIADITGAAYAMIYPSASEDVGSVLIDTMKSEVPIITAATGAAPEICGDAALYADPQNFEEIALKMMQVFKDEKLRKELIDKGRFKVQKYTWQNSGKLVWNSIEKAVKGTD